MSSRAIRNAMVVSGGSTGSKKRRRDDDSGSSGGSSSAGGKAKAKAKAKTKAKAKAKRTSPDIPALPNPYLEAFEALRASWPAQLRDGSMLDPGLDDDARSELWEQMCEEGEEVRSQFAWAIPDERALRILQHFSPILEVGAGFGYWAHMLELRGADVDPFDIIGLAPAEGARKAMPPKKRAADAPPAELFWTAVRHGGPEALRLETARGRSLLLCYPDETMQLAEECLRNFTGDTILHVGELVGSTLSLEQAPWGRTTAKVFQQKLMEKVGAAWGGEAGRG